MSDETTEQQEDLQPSDGERSDDAKDLASLAFDDADLQIRSMEKRELVARIAPFNEVVETPIGLEMFKPGSFSKVDPKKVILTLEHKGAFGPPVGRGMWLEERSDGAYMGFKVSKTQHGDDALQLAADGVTSHVSVVYHLPSSEGELQYRSGRRVSAWNKVSLREVATTWKPIYERAAVLEVRSKQPEAEGEATSMADQEKAVVEAAPPVDDGAMAALKDGFAAIGNKFDGFAEKFTDRMTHLEEQQRSQFTIPSSSEDKPKASRGEWVQTVLKILSGERVPDMQMRALDDLITSDNAGVVPDAISTELIGVIDPSRPFMNSTRRLETPSSGLTLVMPVLTQRPTVAVQSSEKAEVDSTKTIIDTTDFTAATYAGGGDISLQLLKRSSPSFLSLYVELLAEAYALTVEAAAVADIMAAGVNSGGALDPEALALGSAWTSAVTSSFKRGPDTIWMSSAAVAAFIDAKNDGSNAPLYSQLSANFTAGGGVGGSIQGLRAIYVPAMDATANDVLVGPSRGFAWAEDGTFTLQVDVPAKAGRDVAMVGIVWFAALYPAAFTAYSVSGGGS